MKVWATPLISMDGGLLLLAADVGPSPRGIQPDADSRGGRGYAGRIRSGLDQPAAVHRETLEAMAYSAILYEKRDHVAILTLTRPDRLNAMGAAVRPEV